MGHEAKSYIVQSSFSTRRAPQAVMLHPSLHVGFGTYISNMIFFEIVNKPFYSAKKFLQKESKCAILILHHPKTKKIHSNTITFQSIQSKIQKNNIHSSSNKV